MGRNSPATALTRANETQLRAVALTKMNPRLREVFTEISQHVSDHMGATIEFYYNVGARLLDVRESPNTYLTAQQRADNVKPDELLLQAFGGARDAMNRAAVFATLYTKADLNRLLTARSKPHPDFHFQWAHIRHLVSIDPRSTTSQTRLEFEARTRENGWTPDELAKNIQAYFGGRRSKGGRPLSIPKTLSAQVEQVIEMSDLFLRRHKEVWNGPNHSIFVNLMKAPATPEAVQRVQAIKHRMAEVQEAARSQIAMCEQTLEYLETAKQQPAANTAKPAAAVAARTRKLANTK